MFKVKGISVLEELGFIEYSSGYSKKIAVGDYDFIDFSIETQMLKKVKFIENEFVYEDLTYEDLYIIVNKSLNVKTDKIKKYIEKNFERIN